jgi:hypothetical protein
MVDRYSGLDSTSCSFSEKDMASIDVFLEESGLSTAPAAGGGTMLKSRYESVWVVLGVSGAANNTNETKLVCVRKQP